VNAPSPKRLVGNLLLLAGTLVFFAVVVELALRLAGFQFVLRPQDIQFGRPEPVLLKVAFLEDDELFWVQRDYPQKLARLEAQKPPLILLGDSCTDLGRWDRELAALYRARFGQELSYGNLAVAGWSSYQGRRQLERDVPAIGPKVVLSYFGWNDHWIGFGIEDKNVAGVKKLFSSRTSGSRLVQLLTKAYLAWGTRETDLPNRVSLADFKANLGAMAAESADLGARLMILTAPANHVPGQEPPGLEDRWMRDDAELVPLHQAYVAAAREAAEGSGALLCDLAAEFAALPAEERARLFMADGIHFQPAGDARLALFVFACLEEAGLVPLATP
jgi:lysophospholipase L1-like esterase